MKYEKLTILTIVFTLLLTLQINAQLLNSGALDPTFGSKGKAPIQTPKSFQVTDIKLQPDGKIVVTGLGGYGSSNYGYFTVARYNSDGTPDSSFGKNGINFYFIPYLNWAKKLAIQNDGKIIVAGTTLTSETHYDFGLIRLNTDGTQDLSFGIKGIVKTDFSSFGSEITDDSVYDLLVQPDNKIVVAGLSGKPLSGFNYSLSRYNENGTLDETFGTNGKISSVFPGTHNSSLTGLSLQPDGKLIAVGTVSFYGEPGSRLLVARFDSNGFLDESFNNGGYVIETVRNQYCTITSLALQPDGKILIAGNDTVRLVNQLDEAFLIRYNSDGSLDLNFGNYGKQFLTFVSDAESTTSANSIMLQSDGKIMLLGGFRRPTVNPQGFGLARFQADGNLDESFGTNGIVLTTFGGSAEGKSLAIQPDGKIIAAGIGSSNPMPYSTLVRYLWRRQRAWGKY